MEQAKTAEIRFADATAREEFCAAWVSRSGENGFDPRDLNTRAGAERAADIANEVHGVRVVLHDEAR